MVKKSPTKNFEDLNDVITYEDYAEWMGIGVNLAREKFNSRGFPLLKGFGNRKLANKYQVFLHDLDDDEVRDTYAKEFAMQMLGRKMGEK